MEHSKQHCRGFTLLETLMVIGIVAILATISITSILAVRKNMAFKECNDNAYAIYMAAQSNLTQMRSMGQLPLLEEAAEADRDAAFGGSCLCSYSKGDSKSYDLIVPATLDAHVRNQQVIIEYHPKSGIVYTVFYYEGTDSLLDFYAHHSTLREDKGLRKDLRIGYYTVGDVDAINSENFTLYQISSDISYSNADKGILTVSIPVKDQKGFDIFPNVDAYSYLANRLDILLTISGQHGGQFSKTYRIIHESGAPILNFSRDDARYKLHVEIPLDSLSDSFMNLGMEMVDGTLQNPIAAGDNISVTAEVSFSPGADDPILIINSATMTDINPMYHGLVENPEYDGSGDKAPPYILTISNGRHLQNLNLLDGDFAGKIAAIRFVKEHEEEEDFFLDWYEDLNFVPIHLPSIPKIDGNGVTIRNLSINASAGVPVDGSTKRYAGLFAALSDAVIENITLTNFSIDTTDALASGGLVGMAQGVTMKNCHIADAAITGAGNVGGLVGDARKSAISNCTIRATVSGSENSLSNVGGLAGSTLDTTITACIVEDSTISSGPGSGTDSNKNALGGLIGSVSNSGGNTDFPVSGCEIQNSVTVTSVEGSLSNLGGMAGQAKNAYFSECQSSAVVLGQGTSGNIPNNNLGGFVGISEGTRYAVTDVTLNALPQYAADSGGFAGILSGDSVENLDILIQSNSQVSRSVTNFGGIASICNGNAQLNGIHLTSSVTLNNAKSNVAGGFISFQGPARIDNSSIVIPGISHVTGLTKAGFAITNTGTVLRSFTNTGMDGGWAFVKENTGIIKNCYGWTWGADQFPTLGKCSYTYFVEGSSGMVQLYDMDGTLSPKIPDTDALSDPLSLSLLTAGGNDAWKEGAATGYPYPQLANQDHRGNSAAPVASNYPYALRYVETYANGTGDLVVVFDQDRQIINIIDHLQDQAVSGTAYYLYHRTDPDLISSGLLATFSSGSAVFDAGWSAMEDLSSSAAAELFTAYQLEENASFSSLNLQTWYPLYGAGGACRIRTGEQFRNIAQNPDGIFYLDRDITVTATVSSFSGKLYGNNHTISAQVPLFGTLGSSAVIENFHIETDGSFHPFGDLPGTAIDATHWTAAAQSAANVDDFETTFTPVTGSVKHISISLPGCTINGENALVTRHYYRVDTGSTQIIPGDSASLELTEIQGLTCGELASGNYYVKSSDGNSFLPLTVIVAEDGGLILTAGSIYLEKPSEALNTPVEIPIFAITGNIPGNISGSCCLLVDGKYLSAAGNLFDALPEDGSCIWNANGDGSYSCSGVTLTPEGILTSQNSPVKFTLQKISHIYPCEYLGSASVIAGS